MSKNKLSAMNQEVYIAILTSSIIMLSFLFLPALMTMPATAQDSNVVSISSANNTANQTHFQPPSKEIASRESVMWKNNDMNAHTVTSIIPPYGPLAVFDSGPIPPKGNFSYTFETPGSFEYYCAIHPTMTGNIIVR